MLWDNPDHFRLVVCGGRNFTDRAAVFRALDAAHAPPNTR